MRKIVYKLAAGAVSATLLMGFLAGSVLAADLEIKDNGAGSNNTITVTQVSICNVEQESVTLVGASVSASSSTGGNQANNNTGGNVSLTTGNATATAANTVTGGSNTANNPCCCNQECANSVPSSTISDNGNRSTNTIDYTGVKVSNVEQESLTGVLVRVRARARTGKNKANGNTGGTTTVSTGVATSGATNTVTGGSNTLINP